MLGFTTGPTDVSDVGRVSPLPNKKGMFVTAYNASGGSLAVGQPVLLRNAHTAGREVSAYTAATAAFPVWVGVLIDSSALASGSIGKFQITGECEALIDDTSSIAAGRAVELINAGVSFIDNGASLTDETAAWLRDAVTAAEGSGSPVLKTVVLEGRPHHIEAS